jgi:hypothetical protein
MLPFRRLCVGISRQPITGTVRELPAIEFHQIRNSERSAERLPKNSDT